jgi:ankyrin repeat protein
MDAAKAGAAEVVQLLLERHASVDLQDADGRTGLIWAATKGDWPIIVASLVKAGAQVNLKDRSGNTALSRSKLLGHSSTVQMLTEAKAR